MELAQNVLLYGQTRNYKTNVLCYLTLHFYFFLKKVLIFAKTIAPIH